MSGSDESFPADLLAGYRRFRDTRYPAERERYRRLADEGQRPRTMVVACSDSRSGPETVFDASPGELFVVRNVAALVRSTRPMHAAMPPAPPSSSRSSPSASARSSSWATGAAVAWRPRSTNAAPLTTTDFIGRWVAPLRDLVDDLDPSDWADPGRSHRALEFRSIEQSIVNLRTFPWIRSREMAASLALHGAWFDIGLGELHGLTAAGWVLLPPG